MINVCYSKTRRENRLDLLIIIFILTEIGSIIIEYNKSIEFEKNKKKRLKPIKTSFRALKTVTNWTNLPYYMTRLSRCFRARDRNTFSVNRPIDALEMVKRDGFGNNVCGVMHSLSVAEDLNITDIYVNTTKFWWIDMNQTIDRFRFRESPPSENLNVLRDDFFKDFRGYSYRRNKYHHLFASHIKTKFPKLNLSNDTLVIHVRTGDIYSTFIQPGYSQPPLCYYKAILNKYKWKRVILLAQDQLNPVIPALIKLGAEYHNLSLRETIRYMYYAKTLAIGCGTFGFGILRMCDQPKVVYEYAERDSTYYGYQFNGYEYNHTLKIFLNPRTEDYNSKMRIWKNTKEQHELQLTSICDPRWFQVTNGSRVPFGII